MHKKLERFDFSRRIHYFNVGEAEHRSWDDCRTYGFLSAGYGLKYANQVRQLHKDDVVVAYLSKRGYVGVGRVTAEAVPARDFCVRKKPLEKLTLDAPAILHHSDDLEKCEYVIRVRWLVAKKREDALWERNYGLYKKQLVRASLANQQKTLRYIEKNWRIRFESILEQSES